MSPEKKILDTAHARLNLTFALLLAMLLVLAGAVLYGSYEISADHLPRQRQAGDLLTYTDRLEIDLLNIETGKRGYLLTGDKKFLQPYTSGTRRFAADMEKVRQINTRGGRTVVDPELLQSLENKYGGIHALFERQIEARRNGSIKIVNSGDPQVSEGKSQMDSARKVLNRLQSQALKSRTDARQRTKNAVRDEMVLAVVLGLLALLTVGVSSIFVRRGLVRPLENLRDRALSTSQLLKDRRASEILSDDVLSGWEWDGEDEKNLREIQEVRGAFATMVGQIRLQTERTRSLITGIDDPLVTVDLSGRVIYFNAAAARLTGFDAGEMVGRELASVVTEADGSIPGIREVMSTGEPVKGAEELLRRKDGGVISVISSSSVLRGEDGSVVGGLKIMRDITDLRQAEDRYRSLYENAVEGIFQTTPEGRLLTANPAMARMFGYESPREMTRSISDLGHQLWLDPALREEFIRRLREQGTVSGFETRMRRKDGAVVWVFMTGHAVRDAGGEMVALEGSLVDITERKRAEEKLKAFAAELERSNRELQDFAYVASHDLQEPLRKIRAFGDRLKRTCGDDLDPRARDYLERMQNAAERMQNLISDLLAFSRVTTRAKPFVPVNLQEVAREVLSDLEARIERTGGRVEVGDLPTINADPTQMRQLLQNLISNALKFHRENEPPVVKVHGEILHGESCELVVEDNGIGFDEKYTERIFGIFERLHGRGEYEGTGVELSICKKIVERHGGSIKARSAPGQGAKFIITLPVRQPGEEVE